MTPVVPLHGTIRSGRDIARVVRSPQQRAGRLLVIHAAPRGDDEPARVAVIASRRVGGAVQRNRAKRLLREAVRHVPLPPGVDVVLIARRACAESGFAAVHHELDLLTRSVVMERPAAGARS
ncbi:MAG: ribonuclease P protein component [Nitriliruptoraceae bacterium]